MRSLRGDSPWMPTSTAPHSYESWHACNRGNASVGGACLSSGRPRLVNVLSAWPLVCAAWNIEECREGAFWDDVEPPFACFAWCRYWLMFRSTSFIGRCERDGRQNIYKCKLGGSVEWWMCCVKLIYGYARNRCFNATYMNV